MIEGNISGTDLKNSSYCIYYPDMLKTYQRETKFFEFSRDANKKGLQMRKTVSLCNGIVAITSLQWLSFVAMAALRRLCGNCLAAMALM